MSWQYAAGGTIVLLGSNFAGRSANVGASISSPSAILDTATAATRTVSASGYGAEFTIAP